MALKNHGKRNHFESLAYEDAYYEGDYEPNRFTDDGYYEEDFAAYPEFSTKSWQKNVEMVEYVGSDPLFTIDFDSDQAQQS